MNERQRIHAIFDELNIPAGRFALSGSGVMVLHGMERKPRDIDIFVATSTWFSMYAQRHSIRETTIMMTGSGTVPHWSLFTTDPDDPKRRCDPPYLYRTMYGIEVNVFHDWRRRGVGDIDVNFWIHNAELVEGIPCIPLTLLLTWKEMVGRNKDIHDIRAIREHLGLGIDESV